MKKKTNLTNKITKQDESHWGQERVHDSNQQWKDYSEEEQNEILAKGNKIFEELSQLNQSNVSIDDPKVTELLDQWYEFLSYFYTPSLEVLRGLGQMYNQDERFKKNFEKYDKNFPRFLEKSINNYVDDLELEWLMQQEYTLEDEE